MDNYRRFAIYDSNQQKIRDEFKFCQTREQAARLAMNFDPAGNYLSVVEYAPIHPAQPTPPPKLTYRERSFMRNRIAREMHSVWDERKAIQREILVLEIEWPTGDARRIRDLKTALILNMDRSKKLSEEMREI